MTGRSLSDYLLNLLLFSNAGIVLMSSGLACGENVVVVGRSDVERINRRRQGELQ